MARRNSRLGNIITSDKHEITWSNLSQDASGTKTVPLVIGTQPSVTNLASEAKIGSKVTSIFMEFHFSAETITNTKVIHWEIVAANTLQTKPTPSTYYQPTRALVIHRGMEMLPKDVGTVFKRVIVVKIPRVYQRIRDQMTIDLLYICSSAETINACGIAIYKSYS